MLTLVQPQGDISLHPTTGMTVAQALQEAGSPADMPCGGKGRCGKCRIWATGRLSPPSAEELALLSEEELRQGIRLACCCRVLGDARVRPAWQEAVSQICTAGLSDGETGQPLFQTLGAAIDIGTTTLAARLYDQTGLLAEAAAPNPQRVFGADVISRVGSAMAGQGQALAETIQAALSDLMAQMCQSAHRSPGEIDGLVITGNTAMLHFLTGEDPSPLAAAPFEAKALFGAIYPASRFHFPCHPEAKIYLPRCVSAFVGGDITTALLASRICDSPETALLTDIGTNGEIVLWHKGHLLACSTAAGPAFEGAGLSAGMQGAPGAIDHARAEAGKLIIHTLGDKPALGICGSGALDVTAALLALEEMDETGFLAGEDDAYPLADKVFFTQKDIRQIQLAKSAIRAGLETLMYRAGVKPEELSQLAVAGGFGSFMDLGSAAAIGLLPPEGVSRCRVLGNAALSGAAMVLRDFTLAEECQALAHKARTLDLSSDPYFMDQYVENMMF